MDDVIVFGKSCVVESIGALTEDDVVGGLEGLGVAFLKLCDKKESMSKFECID